MKTEIFLAKLIIGIACVVVASIALNIHNELHTEVIPDVTVQSLQQQTLIKGSKNKVSTEIRYLIITDKGTFVCESSLVNGKFNNSDIFWHLKEGKKYTFYVSGHSKSMLFDYQNILKVENEY